MSRSFYIFFVPLISVLIFSYSCAPRVVYVCGDTHNVTTNRDLACYWKDGIETDLGVPEKNSQARGIFVNNEDVYAVGYYSDNGHTIACYWKNGVKTDLEDNTYDSRANAVYHDGVHLYVSGFYASDGKNIAVLWLDGEKIALGPAGVESTVNSVTVVNNLVYAAGGVNSNPVYFKYDVTTREVGSTTLSTDAGELAGIIVNGSDIYASGFVAGIDTETLTAAYWKNGAITTFSTPPDVSVGFGMALDEENIYVTGMFSTDNDQDPKPVYWKNGTPTALSVPQTNDRGPGVQIAIVDGSIYIAGLYMDDMNGSQTYRIPAYWKDGVRKDLLPADSFGSAVGMFVK